MVFDQAAPLQDWDLPDAFATLQRLLEARQGKTGKREYMQVLRLLERFEMAVLLGAARDALQMGAISFDAIKHLRERRVVERRIKSAKFPAVKGRDGFDFKAIPSLNKMVVLELALCDWIERRENVIALGPSGIGSSRR